MKSAFQKKLTTGFTLIELLTVIGVFLVVVTIIFTILTTSLRGSAKTSVISAIGQNGNQALSQMVKSIRDAKKVTSTCASSSTIASSISILTFEGSAITYGCPVISGVTSIASGTASLADGVSLLDTNAVVVQSGTCSFTCTRALGTTRVDIQFALQQPNGNALFESRSQASFKTSVGLRN